MFKVCANNFSAIFSLYADLQTSCTCKHIPDLEQLPTSKIFYSDVVDHAFDITKISLFRLPDDRQISQGYLTGIIFWQVRRGHRKSKIASFSLQSGFSWRGTAFPPLHTELPSCVSRNHLHPPIQRARVPIRK